MFYKRVIKDLIILRTGERIISFIYNSFRSFFDVKFRTVLIESQHGKEFFGNPFYICKHLLENEEYSCLKIVVVLNNYRMRKHLPFNGRNLKFCKRSSVFYAYWLAVSQFLVNDVTFPAYFSRRENQKYLNTWHGTPLKTLGRRTANSPFFGVANAQRNFLHATHILAPNLHTEKVLLKDYMIEKIWDGIVLRGGYPRNDAFKKVQSSSNVGDVNKKTKIAFMPTWRGSLSNIKNSSIKQISEIEDFFIYLDSSLPEEVELLVRLHPIVAANVSLEKFKNIKFFPMGVEPYYYLNDCDVLITDYSSVMFDFAVTRKPIILYLPDEESYCADRNFCLEFSEIPFPKARNKSHLISELNLCISKKFICPPEYKTFVRRFCSKEGSSSSSNLCAHFFLNKKILQEKRNISDSPRRNILLFCGSFLKNGITTSLKNLLSIIDTDRYNIYLWIDEEVGHNRGIEYFKNLDKTVYYIATKDLLSIGIFDAVRFFIMYIFCKEFIKNDDFLKKIWFQDYRRRFCEVDWDTIVHFAGYDRIPTFIMLASNAKKVVYMHNDMYQEIKSKRVYDPRVLRLSYDVADIIASVRVDAHINYDKKVMDISRKIQFVPNTISLQCRNMAREDVLFSLDHTIRSNQANSVINALEKPNRFRFINLARFSPEKGQMRLIDAFEEVWQHNPRCQLFIVGGHGVLYGALLKKAVKSPAADAIYILLGSDNPFPLMKRMNAFVFSSFYEGIGLVLYESFALGLPVISTDIPGPSELLKQGYGLVVDNNTQGLVTGMYAALDNEIPFRAYDFEKHNKEALKQFYKVVS
jgi:CDP-glycerol glycerophosphotransferase